MSRGAIISMIVVISVLPAFLLVFDKLVGKTTNIKLPNKSRTSGN